MCLHLRTKLALTSAQVLEVLQLMVLDKTKNRQNVMLQETGRVKTLEFAAKVAETEEAAGACHGLPMKRGIATSSRLTRWVAAAFQLIASK